ncbi:MAG: hypothetical protein LRZ88_02810 [Candidatus Cloacimonetes bacterium]|nr:hypothetical protein [Candidatus Cloacimonadota bacterium]
MILRFYAALTIPAALYYVGSGIHLRDLKLTELRKLLGLTIDSGTEHWDWVRQIFRLTTLYTPLLFAIIFGILLYLRLIPGAWFAVIILNTALPITRNQYVPGAPTALINAPQHILSPGQPS